MPRYSYLTNCTKYYQSIKLRPRLHLLFSLVMVWSFIIPGPLGPHLITMVSLTTTVLVLRTFWHLPTFTPFSYLYHFFIFFSFVQLMLFYALPVYHTPLSPFLLILQYLLFFIPLSRRHKLSGKPFSSPFFLLFSLGQPGMSRNKSFINLY